MEYNEKDDFRTAGWAIIPVSALLLDKRIYSIRYYAYFDDMMRLIA